MFSRNFYAQFSIVWPRANKISLLKWERYWTAGTIVGN